MLPVAEFDDFKEIGYAKAIIDDTMMSET